MLIFILPSLALAQQLDFKNILGVSLPSYSQAYQVYNFKDILWNMLLIIIPMAVVAFSLYPSDKLIKGQQMALATSSCYMLLDHQLTHFIASVSILVPVEKLLRFLITIIVCVLTLNVRFRRLFSSIGLGYVVGYTTVLILKMTHFPAFILLTAILMFCFLLLAKAYDRIFYSAQIAFVCSFLILVALNITFNAPITTMHNEFGKTIVSVMGKIMMVLWAICLFVYSMFTDKVLERIDKVKEKVMKKSNEKVENEADEKV